MNWVAPIKDEETLKNFKEILRTYDDKYYIMFEIGVGTGLQLQDILKFKVKDIINKDSLTVTIGTKHIKRVFKIPKELQTIISEYVKDMDPNSYLVTGYNGSNQPLSREQAYRIFKSAGRQVGISSIGAQTMRKTFAWHYYKETGDIYYLQNLFNHASPSITYRYIGEKPNVQVVLKKMTAEENERSRYILYKNGNGKKRLNSIISELEEVRDSFDNPSNNDAFYGKVDCLLSELDELMTIYRNTK